MGGSYTMSSSTRRKVKALMILAMLIVSEGRRLHHLKIRDFRTRPKAEGNLGGGKASNSKGEEVSLGDQLKADGTTTGTNAVGGMLLESGGLSSGTNVAGGELLGDEVARAAPAEPTKAAAAEHDTPSAFAQLSPAGGSRNIAPASTRESDLKELEDLQTKVEEEKAQIQELEEELPELNAEEDRAVAEAQEEAMQNNTYLGRVRRAMGKALEASRPVRHGVAGGAITGLKAGGGGTMLAAAASVAPPTMKFLTNATLGLAFFATIPYGFWIDGKSIPWPEQLTTPLLTWPQILTLGATMAAAGFAIGSAQYASLGAKTWTIARKSMKLESLKSSLKSDLLQITQLELKLEEAEIAKVEAFKQGGSSDEHSLMQRNARAAALKAELQQQRDAQADEASSGANAAGSKEEGASLLELLKAVGASSGATAAGSEGQGASLVELLKAVGASSGTDAAGSEEEGASLVELLKAVGASSGANAAGSKGERASLVELLKAPSTTDPTANAATEDGTKNGGETSLAKQDLIINQNTEGGEENGYQFGDLAKGIYKKFIQREEVDLGKVRKNGVKAARKAGKNGVKAAKKAVKDVKDKLGVNAEPQETEPETQADPPAPASAPEEGPAPAPRFKDAAKKVAGAVHAIAGMRPKAGSTPEEETAEAAPPQAPEDGPEAPPAQDGKQPKSFVAVSQQVQRLVPMR